MARHINRLTARACAAEQKAGLHADGGGLFFQISGSGTKSWVVRFTIAGKVREMGLGSYPTVPLADARERAADARRQAAAGVDPIEARRAARVDTQAEARVVTFRQAADRFLEANRSTWKNPKHSKQWESTLDTYAMPVLGPLSVAEIDTPHINMVLDGLWHRRPETASRLRGRLERILNWATSRGYRNGANPARWRHHLDAVYPRKSKFQPVRHLAAVPVDDMPAIYARLRDADGIAALACRFVIVTAARVGMVTGITAAELEKPGLWIVPAERMKTRVGFTIPLSREAQSILKTAAEWRARHAGIGADGRIFPGFSTSGRPLSETALAKALRSAGAGEATTHGCRSTFKDWASEHTGFANEVSEAALAHSIGSRVERAYRRGDLLRKRSALMDAWAAYLTADRTARRGQVVELQAARHA